MNEKKQMLQKICNVHDICLMYVFGSRSQEAIRILNGEDLPLDDPLADIDVGVVCGSVLPTGRELVRLYSRIQTSLEDLFLPYKMDLSLLQEHHSVFQAEAVKGVCVFAQSPEGQSEYEEDVLRRACDFRPFLEKYYDELLEVN